MRVQSGFKFGLISTVWLGLSFLTSCAPSAPVRVQFAFQDGANGALYSGETPSGFGVPALDNSLCYAVHVTADDLMVGHDSDSCAADSGPGGLGQVAGMFNFGTTATFDVKVGPARRFDLIGFRKVIRSDLIDSDHPNPDAAPAACPSNLRAEMVDVVESGITRKKTRLYIGDTPFDPQELFLATATKDIVAGTNLITLTLVHNSDGAIGTQYGGNCNSSPKRIFVTDAGYIGDLGGVSGADVKCNADVNKPTAAIYKALLVTTTLPAAADRRIACLSPYCGTSGLLEHTNWVIRPNTEYFRADGVTRIGISDANGLFTSALEHSFTDTTYIYWSGFNYDTADWTTAVTLSGDDNVCDNWTSNLVGTRNGKSGDTTFTDFRAFSLQQDWCGDAGNLHHLVCVEQ